LLKRINAEIVFQNLMAIQLIGLINVILVKKNGNFTDDCIYNGLNNKNPKLIK